MERRGRRGYLISFEGIDASGKHTQSKMLFELLKSKNIPTEYVSFPDYGTSIGKEIRAFLSGSKDYNLEARHLLYAANRYEHKERIEKWLDEDKIVVVNRYSESNLAYGAANGLPLDWLRQVESQMPEADFVFLLRATSELSKLRKAYRDRYETDYDFLRRVASIYDALAKDEGWFSIDADRTKEEIHYEISKLVMSLIVEAHEAQRQKG